MEGNKIGLEDSDDLIDLLRDKGKVEDIPDSNKEQRQKNKDGSFTEYDR